MTLTPRPADSSAKLTYVSSPKALRAVKTYASCRVLKADVFDVDSVSGD